MCDRVRIAAVLCLTRDFGAVRVAIGFLEGVGQHLAAQAAADVRCAGCDLFATLQPRLLGLPANIDGQADQGGILEAGGIALDREAAEVLTRPRVQPDGCPREYGEDTRRYIAHA